LRAVYVRQVLERQGVSETDVDELMDEVTSLIGLRHDNIARLIGVCCNARPLLIVSEHDFSITLKDKLRATATSASLIGRAQLIDVAVQVLYEYSH